MMKQRILMLLLIISVSGYTYASQLNQLKQIDYHKLATGGAARSAIELGKLSFYFANTPEIIPLVEQKQGKRTFLLPHTDVINDVCKKTIAEINKDHSNLYAVHIEPIYTPVKGMKISIMFDENMLDIGYDLFQSIKQEHGVVFYFYNKQMLKQLRIKSNPLLRTAMRHSVVIDCGHGGSDTGTMGYNIQEKDINLSIGLEAARLLRAHGITVFLTRDKDCTVPLDWRTTYANACNADIFVSIHANASSNKHTSGLETYVIVPSLLNHIFDTLALEDKRIIDHLTRERCRSSSTLAYCVHSAILQEASHHQYTIVDRKVKYAVSQVLLGTIMPAVLIEVGFLSHEREAQLLGQPWYQHTVIAAGISNGIMHYFKS